MKFPAIDRIFSQVIDARPSTTALRVAMRRAAHQLSDNPTVLDDPIAVPILGEKAQAQICLEEQKIRRRASRYVRAFMVMRSRFAEDNRRLGGGMGRLMSAVV